VERTLEVLEGLREDARDLLHLASPAAREEWLKVESRFPSPEELREGYIALSQEELDEIQAKVRRFRDILSAARWRGRGVRVATQTMAVNPVAAG
jgi:hypothetical protein